MRRGDLEEKRYIFRTRFKPLYILSLISVLVATMFNIIFDSYGSHCNPIVAPYTYNLIQTQRGSSKIHGYNRVSNCGQEYFVSQRVQGDTNLTRIAEDYADSMLEKYGTSFLDFQFPDTAFRAIDFGFATFPAEFDCSPGTLSSNVYLSAMITVDGFRVTLLSSFIEYYVKMGVEVRNILVTVQMRRESKHDRVVAVLDILKSKGVYYDFFIGEWSSEALMFHQAHKLQYCTGRDDWIIVADSDEFHEYPTKDVKLFLRELDSQKINLVNGIFLDRVSLDGVLKDPTNASNIFELFSLGCRLHRSFDLGTPKKVMAFKGTLRVNRGHHRIALCWFWNRRNYLDLTPWESCPPEKSIELKPYKRRLNVHHFKWMKGQYEATQHKAQVWANTSVGNAYNIVLEHLQRCRGICVKNRVMQCSKQKNS